VIEIIKNGIPIIIRKDLIRKMKISMKISVIIKGKIALNSRMITIKKIINMNLIRKIRVKRKDLLNFHQNLGISLHLDYKYRMIIKLTQILLIHLKIKANKISLILMNKWEIIINRKFIETMILKRIEIILRNKLTEVTASFLTKIIKINSS
jgi:hypothetical protein